MCSLGVFRSCACRRSCSAVYYNTQQTLQATHDCFNDSLKLAIHVWLAATEVWLRVGAAGPSSSSTPSFFALVRDHGVLCWAVLCVTCGRLLLGRCC